MKEIKIHAPSGCHDRVNEQQDRIIAILEDMGRYSPDLEHQTYLAAVAHVMVQQTLANIVSENVSGVVKEVSREGNERITADPRMKQLLDFMALEDKLLKSLGMNTSGKIREKSEDAFTAVMDSLNDDRDY